MDDTRKVHLSSLLLTLFLLISLTGGAAELEYISPEQTKALAGQFSGAGVSEKDEKALSNKKSWSCDMYGVRTRLQVQHGIKLYDWQAAGSSAWKNSGAQPIQDYKSLNGKLSGSSAKVSDEVRFTPDGKLISRLTLTSSPGTVIAYSLCTADY